MSFVRLYKFACNLASYPILLEGVIDKKATELSSQDELWYVPVELDAHVSLGHIKQYRVPQGVYDHDPVWVTEIRYDRNLDESGRRFVCCKELMHVFDTVDARTDTLAKFNQLLSEIETPLPLDAASPMFLSENITKWMALLILCPKPVRDFFKPRWDAQELSDYDVALELQIPEQLIRSVMSPAYDRVYDLLIGDQLQQMELNGAV